MAIVSLWLEFVEVFCSGELVCSIDSICLINSEGLDCIWIERSLSYYFGVEWIWGEDFLVIYDGE